MEDDLKQNFENYKTRLFQTLEQFVYKVLHKIRTDAIKNIDTAKPYPKVMKGRLRGGIVVDVERVMSMIRGQVGVVSNVPYAPYVHEGTRPHWSPIAPLVRWVIYKNIGRSASPSTSRSASKTQTNTAYGIAKGIQKKIATKGTVGVPFLKLALDQNLPFIVREIQNLKMP